MPVCNAELIHSGGALLAPLVSTVPASLRDQPHRWRTYDYSVLKMFCIGRYMPLIVWRKQLLRDDHPHVESRHANPSKLRFNGCPPHST